MSDMRGRMHSWLMDLDEWLLREDPDVCVSAAQETMDDGDTNDGDTDDDTAPEGDAQDAEDDANDGYWRGPATTAH